MNLKLVLSLLVVLVLGGGAAYLLIESDHGHEGETADAHGHHGHHDHHGHDDHDEAEGVRGPHGGRLLEEGDFALELVLVERGGPPEFRAWFSEEGHLLSPDRVNLTVELRRPGGGTETFTFTPEGDYARGEGEVAEPHSFDYIIVADHGGRTFRWEFAAPDMQTTIHPEAAARARIVTERAGPATLAETLSVYGQVKVNADRVARAVPRFGGIVREARKAFGDPVTAGETVAVVETNQSLVTLEVKAPITGVVVDRAARAGETVADGAALYTIADLSEVWVDLNIPKRDHARVNIGQAAILYADDGGPAEKGAISWLSPISSPAAQTLIARVVLDNAGQRWRPGLFVKADIVLSEERVPVAVKVSALQTLSDTPVVFSRHGEIYQARPVELGRRGGGYAEVREGLRAGEDYVVENSFLIKADIGKSAASHEH